MTGFGDEIDASLEGQLRFMEVLGIHALEVRGVDGVNISSLATWQARAARARLDAHGFEVSALGSPIGKSRIEEDFAPALDAFKRTLDIALIMRAPAIRLFSFYVPQPEADCYAEEAISRLMRLSEAAAGSGVKLLHENEAGIYGQTPERCLRIAQALCGDSFALIFDPSNFVQCGCDVAEAWRLLKPYVEYMHIKDSVSPARRAAPDDNPHRVSGGGDARIRDILTDLKREGYGGYLSIEPHLANSAHVPGTRAGKWAAAALALQALLGEVGMTWQEG